jgi:glycosyltransferase involved in cell wall biosynthesis
MKKIMMYPNSHSDSNFYINNLCNILKEEYEVCGMSESKDKGFKTLISGDVYHFNWYESIDSSSLMKTYINYIKRKFLINLLKIFRKKIVWTVHNNMPHNSKYVKLDYKMLKFMAKKADKIHILCEETSKLLYLKKYNKKIYHICHGDYIGNYPKCDINIYDRYNISKDKKIILFIGMISRYKNIDILIESFLKSSLYNGDFILLICGMCKDEQYKNELKSSKYDNIIFDFNFVKDEEMSAYLNTCTLLVAPYDKTSSLNSGTLWMAMSYKKTMILPLIGCLKDFDYNKYLYVYDYNNKQEHINNLINCLNKVNDEKNIIIEKGKKCYNYMINKASWEKNKQKWIALYNFDE